MQQESNNITKALHKTQVATHPSHENIKTQNEFLREALCPLCTKQSNTHLRVKPLVLIKT